MNWGSLLLWIVVALSNINELRYKSTLITFVKVDVNVQH
jgi:hypothetical protein